MLTFIHISDTHLSPDPEYTTSLGGHIKPHAGTVALIEHLNNLPYTPDFVLHTGDVIYDPIPDACPHAKAIFDKLKYPLYCIAGNHDHPQTLFKTFHPEYQKTYYEFERAGVQFICLDSNGPATPPAGNVTDEQLSWLSERCMADDNRPLVIAVHHNVLPVSIPWLDDYMGITNGEAVHAAILPARDRIRGVFFGHVHQNVDIVRDGIHYCSVLSPWLQFESYPSLEQSTPDVDAEPGYNVVTITQNQTFIRRCRFKV